MAVSISATARTITRTAFIGKDFDTYVTEITDFVQQRFGNELYNNFTASDLGIMLIEGTSFALSTLSWFMDRQASETYIETAILPTSVSRLSRLIGYKPSGAVPSTGTAQVELTAAKAFDVTIPLGSQIASSTGKTYETSQDLTFFAGEVGPKDVAIVEGITVEESFIADGTQGQRYALARVPEGRFIADGSVVISVGGVPFDVVDFISFEQTDQVEAAITEDPPTIRFGDGIAGNIPGAGAEIRVSYRATEGAAGPVQAGELTAFSQPVIVAFQVIANTVSNDSASAPGSDSESLSETKSNAPAVFRTADRAVTEEDYTSLVEAYVDPDFGAVAVGRAVISRGIEEDAATRTILDQLAAVCGVTLIFSSAPATAFQVGDTVTGVISEAVGTCVRVDALSIEVKEVTGTFSVEEVTGSISGATGDVSSAVGTIGTSLLTQLNSHWSSVLSSNCKANLVSVQILQRDSTERLIAPNAGLAQSLQTFLEARKEATQTVSVTDGSINLFSVDTTAGTKLLPGFNRTTVANSVQQVVDDFLIAKRFGESVYRSQLDDLLQDVDGVDYVNLEFTSPTSKVDTFGNVIISPFEVVTLGTTTVEIIEE